MPIVNSSRITPISAATSTVSASRDEAQRVRADQHAGDEEADDRHLPHAPREVGDRGRGDDQRRDLRQEGRDLARGEERRQRPAELVEPVVVDAHVVGELVDHRDADLLDQLVLVLALGAEGEAVDRDDVGEDAGVVAAGGQRDAVVEAEQVGLARCWRPRSARRRCRTPTTARRGWCRGRRRPARRSAPRARPARVLACTVPAPYRPTADHATRAGTGDSRSHKDFLNSWQ